MPCAWWRSSTNLILRSGKIFGYPTSKQLFGSVFFLSSVSGWEHCFVNFAWQGTARAVRTVGPKRLLLLSGDALKHEECDWTGC